MAKRRLPDLAATSRRYLENTLRTRLVSPGLERFAVEPRRRTKARAGAALGLALLALVALLLWLVGR